MISEAVSFGVSLGGRALVDCGWHGFLCERR